MTCPPRPWVNPVDSPFLITPVNLIRLAGEKNSQKDHIQASPREKLYPTMDALNILSRCPWIINKDVLETVIEVCFALSDPRNVPTSLM